MGFCSRYSLEGTYTIDYWGDLPATSIRSIIAIFASGDQKSEL